MNVLIRSHHTSVFDDLRTYAQKKLARLQRYLPRVGDVVVEVEHEETRAAEHRYSVQLTARAGDGSILRAEERSGDPRTAFDLAAGVLSRQAQRHGKRLRDRHRRAEGGPATAGALAPEPAETVEKDDDVEEYLAGKIVRVKRFAAKPMSHEEALAQMDLLSHDFFLFLDSATNDYALLYKRRDGGYGLLTPQRG